jgi:segregation and condensation protein A
MGVMEDYRVKLENFAGPMDLLLYLVRKDEVDIYDIPIAEITAQYISYVELLQGMDIEMSGEFLVMAAALMEIKSAMLLPRTESEEGEEEYIDPRAELVRQLLEYKQFKDAAGVLESKAAERGERFTRPDTIISSLQPDSEPELDMEEVSIWSLLEAFDKLMQATGRYQSYEHISDDTPIDLYQIEILHRLQNEGATTFENIFKDRENRLVMVGLFLAMLELIRSQLIWVQQVSSEAPIYVKALTNEPAEDAVRNAIVERERLEEEPVVHKSEDEGIEIREIDKDKVQVAEEVKETGDVSTSGGSE